MIGEQQGDPYRALLNDASVVDENLREKALKAEHKAALATRQYQSLIEDQELKDEAKKERAQRIFGTTAQQAAEQRKAVRAQLLEKVDAALTQATPFPGGSGKIRADNPHELIAAQSEAERIRRLIEARESRNRELNEKARRQGGRRTDLLAIDRADLLKKEYERGMRLGANAEGQAVCRGVLRLAQEMSIDDNDFLPREQKHFDLIETARLRQRAADYISTQPPKPPRTLTGERRRRSAQPSVSRSPRKIVTGGESDSMLKSSFGPSRRRKRNWK